MDSLFVQSVTIGGLKMNRKFKLGQQVYVNDTYSSYHRMPVIICAIYDDSYKSDYAVRVEDNSNKTHFSESKLTLNQLPATRRELYEEFRALGAGSKVINYIRKMRDEGVMSINLIP